MAEPRVHTSQRLWSEECAIADAQSRLDTASADPFAAEKIPAYEFTGRTFNQPKVPSYARSE